MISLYNGIYLELSYYPFLPKTAGVGEKIKSLSNQQLNQTNNGSALTRKCAYYISLIWDEGLDSLSRQQKEIVAGLTLSLLVHLMSQITVKPSPLRKQKYQPQGGTYFFGGSSSTDFTNINETGTLTQPSKPYKPAIRANGTPLTKEEELTLRALLQKKKAAEEYSNAQFF